VKNAAEHIVEFLSFPPTASDHANQFQKFSDRQWKRTQQWLDDAGLAFYFLQKLKTANVIDAVPAWVLSRLEQNFAANQRRVAEMSRRFAFINRQFDDAGVRYAVLKGFSLVPQFCPDATLRYQGDLDYIVDEDSLALAKQVMLEAQYRAKPSPSAHESIFVPPNVGKPSRNGEQYAATAPYAVELHRDVWDSDLHRLPAMQRMFSTERATPHKWNGQSFPALTDEDAFLLQVLHTCRHLFSYWIRMSSLLEIGYFLAGRGSDIGLWNGVDERIGANATLRELAVVTTELAVKVFAAPTPPLVRTWGRHIRPATRVWIENYARRCAFSELPVYQFTLFPRSKLILFLHQQYEGISAERDVVRQQLMGTSRLSRIASSLRTKPSLLLNPSWWKRQLLVRRIIFHTMAGLRYVLEIPRWRWLNRSSVRPSVLDVCKPRA
jgi:hypothetical protein